MTTVWIQAVGTGEGYGHYQNTMAQPRSLGELRAYLSDKEYEELSSIYPTGKTYIWGGRPKEDGSGRRKWERLPVGAPVLFSWDRIIQSAAAVTYKTDNPKLGEFLWGYDPDGELWENIYFVDEPTRLSLPYPDFNRMVGYNEGFYAQSLIMMREEAGNRALVYLGDLLAEPEADKPDEDEFNRAIADLEQLESLDTEVQSKQRVEQRYVRDFWFKGRDQAACAICGNRYPVKLLVAAHIKRRAACSPQEKRDYQNNTMPACTFGCDELFERGYLVVDEGLLASNPERPMTSAVLQYVDAVDGRPLAVWTDLPQTYFRWHCRFHLG